MTISWPLDYCRLDACALLDRLRSAEDPLFVWDVYFLHSEQIATYKPLDDQILDITPFATTSSGDYWAYATDRLPNPEVLLCYHDSYEAEVIARDIPGLVFRQTVAFAGSEDLGRKGGYWNFESARQYVEMLRSAFIHIMPTSMSIELQRIANSSAPFTFSRYATLISENEARQIISDCVGLPNELGEVHWRSG